MVNVATFVVPVFEMFVHRCSGTFDHMACSAHEQTSAESDFCCLTNVCHKNGAHASRPAGLGKAAMRGGSRQSMRPGRHHDGFASIAHAAPAGASAQVHSAQVAPTHRKLVSTCTGSAQQVSWQHRQAYARRTQCNLQHDTVTH